jgi:hypothetical protein
MNEKLMQDLLKAFPCELIEDQLQYIDREVGTGNRRLDLIFSDRRNRLLLVEVQKGSLDTKHIDRHIDFVEGFAEKNPDVDLRLMFIANRIDPLRKSFLERRGYEYLEVPPSKFISLAEKHNMVTEKEVIEDNVNVESLQINRNMNTSSDENQKRHYFISSTGTKEKEFWKLFFEEIDKRPYATAKFQANEFGLHVYNVRHFNSSGNRYSLMFTRKGIFKMNNMSFQGQHWDGLKRLKNWSKTPNLAESFYGKLRSNKILDDGIINVPLLLNSNTPEQLNKKLFECIDLFK